MTFILRAPIYPSSPLKEIVALVHIKYNKGHRFINAFIQICHFSLYTEVLTSCVRRHCGRVEAVFGMPRRYQTLSLRVTGIQLRVLDPLTRCGETHCSGVMSRLCSSPPPARGKGGDKEAFLRVDRSVFTSQTNCGAISWDILLLDVRRWNTPMRAAKMFMPEKGN